MIHEIRAHEIFALVKPEETAWRLVSMKIPIRRDPAHGDHSLKLLELMILIACVRIVDATAMFEIGTFLGNSTLHMALNARKNDNAVIHTLDLPEKDKFRLYPWAEGLPKEYNRVHEAKEFGADIVELTGDSTSFDFSRFLDRIDLVLIDGDHSREAVASDSVWANRMIRSTGVILWHDYDQVNDPGCVAAIRQFSSDLGKDMFHVWDTELVLAFGDLPITERLKARSTPEVVTA